MKKSVYITAALGGMFTALFFICSNVIPPIQLFPGVPITLQIFCVALMAAVLGLRGGLLTMTCIYLLTLAGLPMSAGYTGGIAAFVKPTTGYFIGFSLLAAVIGAYTEFLLPVLKRLGWFTRLYKNKPRLLAADALLFLAVGVVAVCADHL
ncbi:MAG: biotin transporter BioY, partial [Oscillospiraceae bacterium]|jgi:biotin transport system substrate-specific component|nr:biotin transporter BioY [Oscillospiraceae bacterium]